MNYSEMSDFEINKLVVKRLGREHDCGSDYNGDYWISASEYIQDLENRISEYKELVNVSCGEAIDKLIELNDKEV